ncbi:MalY/PatB family protein [Sutcliffiella horikoshii]|uniref:cysteine-S-conjugate beta-lyase n=1 Tax=Sutcliffiella horikoshii TaxID=79883 RepID=A0A1Y0CSD5_9BACI|nr:MalY/PatB family protein [Sutcliffiella horikoshii]ART77817.1 cystathionine beta-lyase [Sutcliffiella horikoshii]TYS60234.1 pyridoxal phosphate-dependent aminotransferase [Sutcliffiella horikoshii]
MKSYDFNEIINRKNTSSVKWDETARVFGSSDVLPMWVADMDFKAPQEVTKAIIEKAEHGIYGYTAISTSVHDAVTSWFQKQHGWELKQEWLTYISGVVPALSATIQTFSNPGDKIIVFSPVYYPFYDMVTYNDRKLITSPMEYRNGRYYMDLQDFEAKLDGDVKLLLLCNPHNPGGTVWTREELEQLGKICVKHNIIIVSDDIHADLVFNNYTYYPLASISEDIAMQTVTCIAPTKTFNMAGLQAAAMITSNQALREKLEFFLKKQGHFLLNMLGVSAMEAAYKHGEQWLDEVLSYIEDNMDYAVEYIQKEIPGVEASKPEGTYLLWIDCRKLGLGEEELKRLLLHKGKLALESGSKFGKEGTGFVRMNVACTKATLQEGLQRLKTALR